MPFSFKQFHIDDSQCGMPVSTDGVLLGAWAPLIAADTVLDIGAGSGLLSLMVAQRSQAKITAIELDHGAAIDCQYNFNQSPWTKRLTLIPCSIQQYCASTVTPRFDHIICNPPYFDNGPQSSSKLRASARHTDNLHFDELLSAIHLLLCPNGRASLILPIKESNQLLSLLNSHSLTCKHAVAVASVEGKEPNRQLLLLTKTNHTETLNDEPLKLVSSFAIRKLNGQYTNEFIQLTKSFYLKL